jgi:hypothetical protein
MANRDNDWAIVVGISHYPSFPKLSGPENDAVEFAAWLNKDAGLPKDNIRLVLSSKFPKAKLADDAKPTWEVIEKEFRLLHTKALQHQAKTGASSIGRRLYVFLAGHGFNAFGDEPVLLTANASPDVTYHFAGRLFANHFRDAGFFEEVVLFMDCCRDDLRMTGPIPPQFGAQVNLQAPARWLYGCATRSAARARERKIGKKVRGVFTAALLEGLRGGAEQQGEVTARSLSDFVFNQMRRFLPPDDEALGELQEPDMKYDENPARKLVLVETGAVTFPVRIKVIGQKGKTVTVVASKSGEVGQFQVDGKPIELKLGKGTYFAGIKNGPSTMFDVPSQQPVVELR